MAATRMEILSGPLGPVEFAPADVLREVAQNVRCILATIKGSVPLDRAFGVNADMLDAPQPVAQARLVSEIVTAIERHEPRVRVVSVTWERPEDTTATMDGALSPRVIIELKPGVDG